MQVLTQNVILQAAIMSQSARMISDQAAITVGAFSVVDTEAGRAASFAVSLDRAVGLESGLCLWTVESSRGAC
jgi:hypothetical protein